MCFALIYFCLASRILFKDKERKWEEIEMKLQTEHDSLVLKSSNKVMNLPPHSCFSSRPDGNSCKKKYAETGWRVFFFPTLI